MPKSTKKIKGPFEKYNLFESININDHCWEEDGKLMSGPGIFCWIYIFILITLNIISLLNINEYKKIGLSDSQIFIRYFFQFLYMFLSVTFMYSMCKRCRGFEGFLILALLGFIASIIALGPIMNRFISDMKKPDKIVKTDMKPKKIVEGNGCTPAPKLI